MKLELKQEVLSAMNRAPIYQAGMYPGTEMQPWCAKTDNCLDYGTKDVE